MESVKEKIAYLRGVLDGDASFGDERTKFMFEKLLLLLEDVTDDLDSISLAQEELEEYVEEIDVDLAYLEDDYYLDGDDEHDDVDYDEEDDDDEDFMVEMECPHCHEAVRFDEGFLYDDNVRITCPKCSTVIFESDELGELDLGDEDVEMDDVE